MTATLIIVAIALYLVLGMGVLVVFDTLTNGRIRKRLGQAANETQVKLAQSGNYTGKRTAGYLFFGALWLFWPVVLVGAMTKPKGENDGKKGQGTPEESPSEERPAE